MFQLISLTNVGATDSKRKENPILQTEGILKVLWTRTSTREWDSVPRTPVQGMPAQFLVLFHLVPGTGYTAVFC